MSENMSTALKIGAAVIMVAILITIGFFIFGKGQSFVDTASKELDSTKTMVENNRINQFIGTDKKGDEVINAIHMLAETGVCDVTVVTGAGNTSTYNKTTFYNVSNPSSAAYINPVGTFTSVATKNGSGVTTKVTFTQN